MTVTDLLHRGKANAVPGRDLVRLLGLQDLRELTQMIEKERRAGEPICASVSAPHGYYIADSPDELRRYLHSLQRRKGEIGRTLAALQNILEIWEATP